LNPHCEEPNRTSLCRLIMRLVCGDLSGYALFYAPNRGARKDPAHTSGMSETITSLAELAASSRATITRAEAARILEIDPRTLDRAIVEGTISAISIGRRVLILREPLVRLLHGEEVAA